MIGRVDGQLRALIRVPLAASLGGPQQDVEAWVDTAAVLADGRTVTVELFGCYLDWFGGRYQTQVVAGDAAYPLLGTHLLAGRRLVIDYPTGMVELT